MATAKQMQQTAERIDRGVEALRAEINRQTALIQDRAATVADLDLRALYLVLDQRAARYTMAASAFTNGSTPAREANETAATGSSEGGK